MTVATTYARAEIGIEAPLVCVEADVSPGLPAIQIVGLPQTAVKESKDRVKAAINSCNIKLPSKRITVNLAPANLPKSGGRYDLAIAVAILAACKKLPMDLLTAHEWLGELSLAGSLRAIDGVLPAALQNRGSSRRLVVPTVNKEEAALAASANIRVAGTLNDVFAYLQQQVDLPSAVSLKAPVLTAAVKPLSDVRGQTAAKRALCIAAAGGHNLLMIGPPGTGKSMLATRLPGLIPPMDTAQSLEVASVASVSSQQFDMKNWGVRPFRSPHHTASAAAMVGGGNPPTPGEISLAHMGVLFLDELPEYSRHVLEVLREPLESGEIWISRASNKVRYPASFQLIAAMNPCPCGYLGDERRECECTPDRVIRYRTRLSGPLLDRIDMHVEVPPLPRGILSQRKRDGDELGDLNLYQQIVRSRETMMARQGTINSKLDGHEVTRFCALNKADSTLLDTSVEKLGISTRGYFKILKVARTIADLAGADSIDANHLIEALGYRRLDRRN